MAQLNSIIGSILRDMVLAQHQANMYAASLAGLYSRNGALQRFPLPCIALGELEIDIHYGIDGKDATSDNAQYEINYPELRKNLRSFANTCAAVMLSTAMNTLQKLFPVESNIGDNPLAQFEADTILKGKYESFLSRKLLGSLRSEFTEIINIQKCALNKQAVKETVMNVGKAEIVNHKDLAELLALQQGSKEKLEQSIETAIDSSLDAALQDANIKRKRLMPSAEVTVSSEELAKLPSDSIQHMRLKLSPRDMQMFDKPNDE